MLLVWQTIFQAIKSKKLYKTTWQQPKIHYSQETNSHTPTNIKGYKNGMKAVQF